MPDGRSELGFKPGNWGARSEMGEYPKQKIVVENGDILHGCIK